VDHVLAPLKELKLLEATMRRTFGTDHASLMTWACQVLCGSGRCGIQPDASQPVGHPRQVWKDELNQGAQVLAAWAYNTAQLPAMLPRRPLPYRPSADAAKAECRSPIRFQKWMRKLSKQVQSRSGGA